MENWKKIRSFGHYYEAELRKIILRNNAIPTVVLAKQDTAFLIGEYELYVGESYIEVANIILEEFRGWRKVNSFPVLQPVEIVQNHLESEGFKVFFNQNNQLGEFELFVKNEDAEKALLSIDSMKPWVLLNSYETVKQAEFRVSHLAKYGVECIIIKRRASDKHLVSVDVLVSPTKYKLAMEVVNEMVGWNFIEKYKNKKEAFLILKVLEKEGIEVLTKFLISPEEKINYIELYVQFSHIEKAKTLIAQKKEWVELARFEKLYQVEMIREILKQNEIHSIFINEKSSMFLLGELVIYVLKEHLEEAQEYLDSWKIVLGEIDEDTLTNL